MKLKNGVAACLALAAIIGTLVAVKPAETVEATQYQKIDLSLFKNGNDIFITPSDLLNRLGDKNLVILDASHPNVYQKGHIPGAVNIGFKGLSNCNGRPGDKKWGTILEKEKLTQKLESLGINNTTFVVVYSDILKGPGACGRAVWQMKMAGLTNVKLLYGGFDVWKRSGYEISKRHVTPSPAAGLRLREYDETYKADQQMLFDNLDSIRLVDVRSLKEFTGEDTHRGEARGGHITGADWLEWKSLLNDDSTPKSPAKIKLLLAEKGIKPTDDFVLY